MRGNIRPKALDSKKHDLAGSHTYSYELFIRKALVHVTDSILEELLCCWPLELESGSLQSVLHRKLLWM